MILTEAGDILLAIKNSPVFVLGISVVQICSLFPLESNQDACRDLKFFNAPRRLVRSQKDSIRERCAAVAGDCIDSCRAN